MIHFADLTDEERLTRLEHKVMEIRKTLFGALLMASGVCKGKLSQRAEAFEILDEMDKAEEPYAETSEPDRFKRLERVLDVIDQRAKTIFDLMSFLSTYEKSD